MQRVIIHDEGVFVDGCRGAGGFIHVAGVRLGLTAHNPSGVPYVGPATRGYSVPAQNQ